MGAWVKAKWPELLFCQSFDYRFIRHAAIANHRKLRTRIKSSMFCQEKVAGKRTCLDDIARAGQQRFWGNGLPHVCRRTMVKMCMPNLPQTGGIKPRKTTVWINLVCVECQTQHYLLKWNCTSRTAVGFRRMLEFGGEELPGGFSKKTSYPKENTVSQRHTMFKL